MYAREYSTDASANLYVHVYARIVTFSTDTNAVTVQTRHLYNTILYIIIERKFTIV
jgi:hypothetical protein